MGKKRDRHDWIAGDIDDITNADLGLVKALHTLQLIQVNHKGELVFRELGSLSLWRPFMYLSLSS